MCSLLAALVTLLNPKLGINQLNGRPSTLEGCQYKVNSSDKSHNRDSVKWNTHFVQGTGYMLGFYQRWNRIVADQHIRSEYNHTYDEQPYVCHERAYMLPTFDAYVIRIHFKQFFGSPNKKLRLRHLTKMNSSTG